VLSALPVRHDPRLIAGQAVGEDAAVVRFPAGRALVQTVDFFTPIVNDPYRFGQIAAANALSDVYAMGGEPLAAMNIVCFPAKTMPLEILQEILRGGYDKVLEAGAVPAGGHSVEGTEIKYGLAVSGTIDPDRVATNAGLRPGDHLVLTKALGTGVLATAVKGRWEGAEELERLVWETAGRLNAVGGAVIRELGLRGATDVTGFGLGGHLLEMCRASELDVELDVAAVPLLPQALELAGMGLVPAGSHANRHFCSSRVQVGPDVPPVLTDLMFDAQTSGGLVLAVPPDLLERARALLLAGGDLAAVVGRVRPAAGAKGRLYLR
jgi:selenide,water dikinase